MFFFFKEKQGTQATGTYSYHAYLETLLNYGPAAKSLNSLQLYFTKMLQGKWTQPILRWLLTTRTLTKVPEQDISLIESRTIEMAGPIFCDVFRSERLLLSYVNLKVILNQNVNEFWLIASEDDADYRVKLTEAYLKTGKVKVSPNIPIAHELALKKRTRYLSHKMCGMQNVYNFSRKSFLEER